MVMIRDIGYVIFVQTSFAHKLGLINIKNMSMEMDHLFVNVVRIFKGVRKHCRATSSKHISRRVGI